MQKSILHPYTEAPEKACTWLGEISSCSCSTLANLFRALRRGRISVSVALGKRRSLSKDFTLRLELS